MEKSPIKLRFAPSPTGELHLGGARTAIFNWLLAQKMGGQFLLRIEDTDQKRSKPEYTDQILSSLKWLGIESDEEPVYQSKKINRHQALAVQLLEENSAFPCFCTPDELAAERKASQVARLPSYRYSGKCRNLSELEFLQNKEQNIPYCIRLKIPTGITSWKDGVYGDIQIENSQIDDFIILRMDGTPTYMLAVVSDDLEMGITHIIRGEDHLTNTAKQILIYTAIQAQIPEFTHLPLILGSDKKKLSKRHNAPSVSDFRQKNYHPEGVMLYLGQLGWTAPNDEEVFSLDRLIEIFDSEHISKKGAVWDEKKLTWLGRKHFGELGNGEIRDWMLQLFPQLQGIERDYLLNVIDIMKGRVSSGNEFMEYSSFFFNNPEDFDSKSLQKRWKENSHELVSEYLSLIESCNMPFTAESLEIALRNLADEKSVTPGEIIHPLRIAVTGTGISPGMFEILEIMGKEKICNRIKTSLDKIGKS